jgi:hypothetical protein
MREAKITQSSKKSPYDTMAKIPSESGTTQSPSIVSQKPNRNQKIVVLFSFSFSFLFFSLFLNEISAPDSL